MRPISDTAIRIEVRGEVSPQEERHARDMLSRALRRASEPVLLARVKLTRHLDPAMQRPAVAQVNLDVNGRLLRAQAAAPTMYEAVNRVRDRVEARLRRMARHWEAQRGGQPESAPHEWRHESVPTERPDYFPRPAEERQLVRRKSFALARLTPEQALADMDRLDYGFYLFTDATSGEDSVVYRTDHGWRLAQATPRPVDLGPASGYVTVSPHPAPRITVAEARERLNLSGLPFVFFVDPASGRACVVYRRYDGHDGLIESVAP